MKMPGPGDDPDALDAKWGSAGAAAAGAALPTEEVEGLTAESLREVVERAGALQGRINILFGSESPEFLLSRDLGLLLEQNLRMLAGEKEPVPYEVVD